jgi:hypothetical protein
MARIAHTRRPVTRRIAVLAALAAVAAAPAAAQAAGPVAGAHYTNISSRPVIRLDLQLAVAYWATTPAGYVSSLGYPTPAACPTMRVQVGQMSAASGNDGVALAASGVAAETGLGSCVITISPAMWKYAAAQRTVLCTILTHEYGHTLGLPDLAGVPMMNANPADNTQPLCRRTPASR